MTFFDENHKNRLKELNELWNNLNDLSVLAKKNGINDIFQDNGAKVLQQIIISNMKVIPGREGNDAYDTNNIEWEFKSTNIAVTKQGFSTDHHTTFEILNRFDSVPWLFSFYSGIQLDEMYVIVPGKLTEWVDKQKKNLAKKPKDSTLNNPKIPIKYVKTNGVKVYPIDSSSPVDPASLIDS